MKTKTGALCKLVGFPGTDLVVDKTKQINEYLFLKATCEHFENAQELGYKLNRRDYRVLAKRRDELQNQLGII